MSLKCPICDSTHVDVAKSKRSIAAPLGPHIHFEIEKDSCLQCGEVGDFLKQNDAAIGAAEEQSVVASIEPILHSLTQAGCSMAYMERALMLPPRTMARWKEGKSSAAGMALLRMVATYPWLLEVADEKFAPRYASAKIVAEAGKVLGGFLQSMVLGPRMVATHNLYETANVRVAVEGEDRAAVNSVMLNQVLSVGVS
jgi:hypothetical protein